MDIKNARSNVYWRAFARLFQMVDAANVCFCFEMAKEKAETFNQQPFLYIFAKKICLNENLFLLLQSVN
ncbi:hypothetical protein [Bacteroides ilei]|uniref:hypothetical protein n=1 Tax=Bacteroides ilei TaxID=1907658 RepID=UPI00093085C3|nr:hypothetical protein [Bacteroides ilei]